MTLNRQVVMSEKSIYRLSVFRPCVIKYWKSRHRSKICTAIGNKYDGTDEASIADYKAWNAFLAPTFSCSTNKWKIWVKARYFLKPKN
jgi:hypothetical protein